MDTCAPSRLVVKMTCPQITQLDSLAELRRMAGVWDDLWRRSDVAMPTHRAELVAQWVEQFAPGAEFRAVIVKQHGRPAAAIPLVGGSVAGVIGAGRLPANEWSTSGELLLDPAAATPEVGAALAAAITELPWPLLWLEDVAVDAPRWRFLREALGRAGVGCHYHELLKIGRIDARGDWSAYRGAWSRKHRQNMTRCARQLAALGPVDLEIVSRLSSDEVEPCLRRGFEIEDRSWKGTAGTSVLRTPGMFDFYARQARRLAEWGQLDLAFLNSAGKPIAFAYGLTAKGVYHSIKVGYDPDYAAHSPGQLLRYYLFERIFCDPHYQTIDYMAPTEAHRKWRPKAYSAGRLVVASGRWLGRAALAAYTAMRGKRARPAP